MLNDKLIKWLSRDQPERSSGNTAKRAVILSTEIGQVRKQNQDRVACLRVGKSSSGAKPFIAIALSDGMGGMKNGAECAVRTISALFDSLVRNRSLDDREQLRIAAADANDYVYKYAGSYGGATLSAILISASQATIINVGDSRIYAETNNVEKRVKRITVDDSLAEIVGGERRELLQFIGMGESIKIITSPVGEEYERLLVTSDGIHFINQETLETVFTKASDLSAAASRLNTIVRWCGAPDNATLAVLSLRELKAQVVEGNDSGIEIWDPFGDFYFSWGREEHRVQVAADTHLENNRIDEIKKEIAKIEERECTPVPKKVTRQRKKAVKKEKESSQNLQIVIEMGENSKESSDESSK